MYVKDSLVTKTNDYILLYNGYKSTIIQNTKTNLIDIYPSENITKISVY